MISKFLQILGLQPRIFKSFSRSLEQFFLTVGQINFGNKIPVSFISHYYLQTFFMKTIFFRFYLGASNLMRNFLIYLVNLNFTAHFLNTNASWGQKTCEQDKNYLTKIMHSSNQCKFGKIQIQSSWTVFFAPKFEDLTNIF